ncbi:MAG: YidC/Oxa1 family membrane protein insertase [Clostridiales bacterium]|nr:YidC/Oxa1 family membrane protein insertase [Clostridiales bacterium]
MTFLDCVFACLVAPLELLFEVIFFFSYKFSNHVGLSIVALSLVVNLLLLPLYFQADKIEKEQKEKKKRMKKWTDHIKKTFKGNERVMMLQTYNRINDYKVTDVFKESISLFLQIPFFIAAYRFLSGMKLLQGISMGPIRDLGSPDGLIKLGTLSLNFLPIFMTLINIAAGFVYSEKGQIKDKIKLILVALVFLVLLYDSPSGLVFYWTLNNLFSLGKNIVSKLRQHSNEEAKEEKTSESSKKPGMDMGMIFLSGAVLAIATGLWIPSDVVSQNPLEMINWFISDPYDPALYMVSSFLNAVGLFLIWIPLFLYIMRNKMASIASYIMASAAFVCVMNYFVFNKNFGLLSEKLIYENPMRYKISDTVLNLLADIAVIAVCVFVVNRFSKYVKVFLVVTIVAISTIFFLNVRLIESLLADFSYEYANTAEDVMVPLSTEGQNVVVIMMDRMMAQYLPYVFNERPDVAKQFDGFTYYPNTASFGLYTNHASPAVFGGYDYTPEELNARSDELLVDKHNESLRVLPTIFADNGWEVTVGDPTYANYQWIADTGIYDNDERIHAYNMSGVFNSSSELFVEVGEDFENRLNRNLFCYGFMKSMPYFCQSALYASGSYTQIDNYFGRDTQIGNVIDSLTEHTQIGIYETYYSNYLALAALSDVVEIRQDDQNCFFMFSSGVTHDACLLQEPEYMPAELVNNTEFDEAHKDRFIVDGVELHIDKNCPALTYANYQTNVAACIELGKFFDYLRENDLYDNTRIIIVADHGNLQQEFDDMMIKDWNFSAQAVNPILMVKDFNSTDFSTSYEFMTNADTPYLALLGLVENPVNPFTQNPIRSDKSGEMHIYVSNEKSTVTNNGTRFEDPDEVWISVKDNIFEDDNWDFYEYKG